MIIRIIFVFINLKLQVIEAQNVQFYIRSQGCYNEGKYFVLHNQKVNL